VFCPIPRLRIPDFSVNPPVVSSADTSPDSLLGHLLIWPGHAVYVGQLLENEAHAHHAIQLSIGLEGVLSFQPGPSLPWSTCTAFATAPDQLHRLRCCGTIAQIYLDPESSVGLSLRERMGSSGVRTIDVDDLGLLSAALRAAVAREMDSERLSRVIDDVTRTAPPCLRRAGIDPRVQRTLTIAHDSPGRQLSLTALADRVALSPSRVSALFRRDIGIPVRRYLLWLRLIDAIEALADGTNLTEAAHAAGFSDSAHLSRTFRRMFGMPPSALRLGRVEIRRLKTSSVRE
jgi:AraC family transcriptional regulator